MHAMIKVINLNMLEAYNSCQCMMITTIYRYSYNNNIIIAGSGLENGYAWFYSPGCSYQIMTVKFDKHACIN